MEQSRRDFAKKSALVVGAAAVATTSITVLNSNDTKNKDNGVITGNSPKKEILYKRSKAWDEFYNQAN